MSVVKIAAKDFYGEYYGHKPEHLALALQALKRDGPRPIVYLAGDSSLDSKHWFPDLGPATNGYETFLDPPELRQDIAYHLNRIFASTTRSQERPPVVLNTAREESTIAERSGVSFHPQDVFIRDNITTEDVLMVSVGGNDVALKPTKATREALGVLLMTNPPEVLVSTPEKAQGMSYFVSLFKDGVEHFLTKLTSKQKPRRIVLCHIYFLDEKCGGWADSTLRMLQYDKNPALLQNVVRAVYNVCTTKVRVPGVEVVTFPMFAVLDGKTTSDYCQAVEPSAVGNEKLAAAVMPLLL